MLFSVINNPLSSIGYFLQEVKKIMQKKSDISTTLVFILKSLLVISCFCAMGRMMGFRVLAFTTRDRSVLFLDYLQFRLLVSGRDKTFENRGRVHF